MKWYKIVLSCLLTLSLIGCGTLAKLNEKGYSYKIKQITLNKQINGSIGGSVLLFTGSVSSNPTYSFYIKYNDGAVVLKNISYKNIEIFEDVNTIEEAYAVGFGSQDTWYYKPIPKKLLVKTLLFNWELHIPKNTICYSINIDTNNL